MREKNKSFFTTTNSLRSIYLIDTILSFLFSMHEKMPHLENGGK